MSEKTIITVENLSKRYVQNEGRMSLRHEGVKIAKKMLGQKPPADEQAPFWALHDVTFHVQQGEAVGVVGRNGSGKTTLLRVLSGITDPTHGKVRIYGRFVTLIGLSAGFDFERTGYENIFLNAAIYGVSPAEVREIIDDIVAFAELGDFLGTPVKRYSSGMVARLGFSIAVHIMPEIIFLDEVLSVGDQAFQEKCINRILELKAKKCTLIFVSHSANSVQMLCERCVWLDNSRLMMDGPTDEVLNEYARFLHHGPTPEQAVLMA